MSRVRLSRASHVPPCAAATALVLLVTVLVSTTIPPSSASRVTAWVPSSSRRRRTTIVVVGAGAADDLLYQEQEKMLVSRGVWEERLMNEAPSAPLRAHVVRGAGSQGGFGGGGGGGNKKKKRTSTTSAAVVRTQARELARALTREGVVRVDNVLTDDTADALRAFLYASRREAEDLVTRGTIPPVQRFADVLLRENRRDMPVPLGPDVVTRALDEILIRSPVGGIIGDLLTDQAVLYELSCLMSDPGSQRQVVHPDTPYSSRSDDEPVLYTCFIALQDIDPDMGPTTWLPHTHTLAVHERFQDETTTTDDDDEESTLSPKDRLLRSQPAVLGTLPKGSCGLYDSRLLHCGGANRSDTSRALFYFSFRNPKISAVGNPGSIRRDMMGRWTLQTLQKELKLIREGKPSGNLVSEP